MASEALTDLAIRKIQPGIKTVRVLDGRGLYLEVSPKGGKWWRLKYRFAGKEKLLSMGTYPDTSLKKAREKRDEARALLASGVDPSEARRAEKASGAGAAGNSLEAIAREFHQTRQGEWSAPHAKRWLERLQKDVFPYVGRTRCLMSLHRCCWRSCAALKHEECVRRFIPSCRLAGRSFAMALPPGGLNATRPAIYEARFGQFGQEHGGHHRSGSGRRSAAVHR
jgi:hypothetical protein